jgi:predicted RNA-binding protein with PUA-like domain
MKYWLLKTEPSVYSFNDLLSDGKTCWDGVTSNAGLKFIRSIQKGDFAFIYHTGNEKCITGISEIVSNPYKDPKSDDESLVVFDIKPLKKLVKEITLTQLKSDKVFSDFALVREGRLTVVPVSKELWNYILKLSDTK